MKAFPRFCLPFPALSVWRQQDTLEELPGPSYLTVLLLDYWILSSFPSPKNSLTKRVKLQCIELPDIALILYCNIFEILIATGLETILVLPKPFNISELTEGIFWHSAMTPKPQRITLNSPEFQSLTSLQAPNTNPSTEAGF